MFRFGLFFIVCLCYGLSCCAQLGVKFGVFNPRHFKTFQISAQAFYPNVLDKKLQYHAGLYYKKKIAGKFGMQPELLYMGSNLEHTFTLAAPFIFTFDVTKRMKATAGSQVTLYSEDEKYIQRAVRETAFYQTIPLGLEYAIGNGSIAGRYLFRSRFENFQLAMGFNLTNKKG